MTAALLPAPFALCDIEDLAEADLDADLSDRLEAAGWVLLRSDGAGADGDEIGRLIDRPGAATGRADAVALAWSVRRWHTDAVKAHDLGLRAAMLIG
ncbi:hypothetical protein [Geodermatophilus sp. CPCC 206100]|uniref:hypothetical protein n=1 Tax=Geodermatophilus sp. CPCC 206100 TaxID=3020054 RepID=UPI003AFFAF8A